VTANRKLRIYNAALLAATLAFTLFNELHLRRWLLRHYGHSSVVAGSLPNFLAAALFGFAIAVVRVPTTSRAALRCAAPGVIGLTLYEVAQIWMPNRTFDWNDVAATFLGGLACWTFLALPLIALPFRRPTTVDSP
jgi:hypothetical protein